MCCCERLYDCFLQENSVFSLKDNIGECEATVRIFVREKENYSMKKSAINRTICR